MNIRIFVDSFHTCKYYLNTNLVRCLFCYQPPPEERMMKIKSLVAAVTLAAALPAGSALAQTGATPIGSASTPTTPEGWLDRMTDFTRNMSAFKDPKVFVPWFQAVTEPSFYTAMGYGMLDPAGWLRMTQSMVHPGAYPNMMEWIDPAVYMKWLAASMDPNFYTALITQLTDPGKMMRWAMWPMDPKLLGLMLQPLNPNLYMKWLMSPLDPRALQLMMAPVNPNLYTGWLGAMINPASYGPTWSGFLNPASYNLAVPGGMTVPGGAVANPFDPSTWTQFFPVPGTAPAAPPAAPAEAGAAQPAAPAYFNPFDPNAWTQMWQGWGAAAPAPAPAAPAPAAPAQK
jgi:hypothetical protein